MRAIHRALPCCLPDGVISTQLLHCSAAGARAALLPTDEAGSVQHSAALQQCRAFAALPLNTGRPRVVVLGTGWASARLVRDLDIKRYDITVVSPRNHMVFTPLLPSTCVGTVEPRSVALPFVRLQKGFSLPYNSIFGGCAENVKPQDRVVPCVSEDGIHFDVSYDKLVIATGSQGSTFGTPGVEEFTHPLRDVSNAEAIRNHLLKNWQASNIPGRQGAERRRLLHTVIVGGGPTGVEFAGELSDFISKDLAKVDNDRARDMRVTLVEASELLGNFDGKLREYAARSLVQAGVHLTKGLVKEVQETKMTLADGQVIDYGLAVWSTGVGPTPFTTRLPFAKTAKGRIAVDEFLRVLVTKNIAEGESGENHPEHGPSSVKEVQPGGQEVVEGDADTLKHVPDVYALGDCCSPVETPLPALAQVAEQQGKYLAKCLNDEARGHGGTHKPFVYHHLGSMASLGGRSAVIELGEPTSRHFDFKGFTSWVAWRSAYLTRLGSIPNRIYVIINWFTSAVFGRDMTRW